MFYKVCINDDPGLTFPLFSGKFVCSKLLIVRAYTRPRCQVNFNRTPGSLVEKSV